MLGRYGWEGEGCEGAGEEGAERVRFFVPGRYSVGGAGEGVRRGGVGGVVCQGRGGLGCRVQGGVVMAVRVVVFGDEQGRFEDPGLDCLELDGRCEGGG